MTESHIQFKPPHFSKDIPPPSTPFRKLFLQAWEVYRHWRAAYEELRLELLAKGREIDNQMDSIWRRLWLLRVIGVKPTICEVADLVTYILAVYKVHDWINIEASNRSRQPDGYSGHALRLWQSIVSLVQLRSKDSEDDEQLRAWIYCLEHDAWACYFRGQSLPDTQFWRIVADGDMDHSGAEAWARLPQRIVDNCWNALGESGYSDYPDRPTANEINESGVLACLDKITRWGNAHVVGFRDTMPATSQGVLSLAATQPTQSQPPSMLPEKADSHDGGQADATPLVAETGDVPRHAPDFSWISSAYGMHNFTATQRPIVKALWEDCQQGGAGLSQAHLLHVADCDSKALKDLFKRNPAWSTLIVRSEQGKGIYRLSITVPKPD